MRQEPHRVYWQQWAVSTNEENESSPSTKRQVVTKSAAVRISDAARAKDVTELLRSTLSLNDDSSSTRNDDSLVLVATLYNAPPVEFEHEVHCSDDLNDTTATTTPEPLHVIKTLEGDDSPLQVRDALLQRLKAHNDTKSQGISPKHQWFFVPSTHNMPNCIELDGYCTSDEHESIDDDESDFGHDHEQEKETSPKVNDDECWWRNELTSYSDSAENEPNQAHDKRLLVEQERLNQLKSCQSASSLDARHLVSGYLLKRSNKDKHVWRRVHCVLTEEYFWFVSRLYNTVEEETTRIAHHGRISLNRAMLMEPTTQNATQIPFSFEVVSKSGISHVFRASSSKLQHEWMACIKNRIQQTQDNDLMQHAELIVEDEALARSKRMMSVAVEPLMRVEECCIDNEMKKRRRNVLTWGMDVAAYRELCRHVTCRMPAKRPIVVVENGPDEAAPTPRKLFASPSNGENGNEELDSDTQEMIRSAWDSAAVLLARATHFIIMNGKPSTSLETQCRHVDYVITGRFRPLSEVETSVVRSEVDRRDDPSPADLFDALLAELQAGCSSSSDNDLTNDHCIETPLGE